MLCLVRAASASRFVGGWIPEAVKGSGMLVIGCAGLGSKCNRAWWFNFRRMLSMEGEI